MLRPLLVALAACALPLAGCGSKSAKVAEPAPASELLAKVDIPYEQFELENGLRVLVHTDRKAPVVAVSIWYDVGSKHEPAGKTGFAHLFEHLMFNGTENVPGDFFEPLRQIGATDLNGTTWFDRTNYFQTVPTPALEVPLFMESDRMGHLLGAVTQQVLDNQRGVVQNEKRQGDNQPYGLVEYAQLAALLPPDHPYGHSTIGSMADLDSASLEDVKKWFTDHYGPNNAILVLAGDIDVATAKSLTGKYFGDIPRGKPAPKVDVPVPTLQEAKFETMKDQVPTQRLYRMWTAPGLNDPEAVPLGIGMAVLGGLSSSRLDNIMVRQEQLAVRVSASYQDFAQLGFLEVFADVKPGVDPDVVAKRLDEIVAQFIEEGPTEDEVQRVVVRNISGAIAGLESVGGFSGKAPTLAEGLLYSGDPDFYKKRLASAPPAQVKAALQKWLKRPVYALHVVPGERDAYEEASGVRSRDGAARGPAFYRPPGEDFMGRGPLMAVDRSKLPEVGTIANLDFPTVESGELSNGIKVYFARREAVPTLRLSVVLDAGYAADPKEKLGTQSLMLALLTEGTTTRNSTQIAEDQERLGASISASASLDRTGISMFALVPNLGLSLDLLADIVKNPAFDPGELERLRVQQLNGIAEETSDPQALAQRTLPPLIYGASHPYGIPFSGTGDPAVVEKLTRDDLVAFHQQWIRPDNATIFAVGDTTLQALLPQLEQRFGKNWAVPQVARGTKNFDAQIPARSERIVLVHRAGSPQSMIYAGQVMDLEGSSDLEALLAGNEVLGGNFLSRINMDLREDKGWSYGVRGSVNRLQHRIPYLLRAPVQTDRTGDAILALKKQFKDFVSGKGVTPEELARTINGRVRELPGSFETSGSVLSQMQQDVLYERPANYVETLAERYRSFDAAALDAAVRGAVDPEGFTWVVVGDKNRVLSQLQRLKIPVTVVDAPKATGG
ncbi:MAG TPA: pitrilysin family protein [Steroidobacteraceae bacterium]|nr:pitrilysin family protein [Steroidobacteraceae bacterium]